MKKFMKKNRETILPLGIASAMMSVIIAAAAALSEISPAAVL